jgi:integrase/recombinase XerD
MIKLPEDPEIRIEISLIEHNGEKRIKVGTPKISCIINRIKEIKGYRWSKTKCCWHVPYNKESFQRLKMYFPDLVVINPIQSEGKTTETKEISLVDEVPPLKIPTEKTAAINDDKKVIGRAVEVEIDQEQKKLYLTLRSFSNEDICFIKEKLNPVWNPLSRIWTIDDSDANRLRLREFFKTRLIKKKKLSAPENLARIVILKNGRFSLSFGNDQDIIRILKYVAGTYWIKDEKLWLIPHNKYNYQKIHQELIRKNYKVMVEKESLKDKKTNIFNKTRKQNIREIPTEYLDKLKIKRYSASTIKTYTSCFKEFISYYYDREVANISEEEVRSYVLYLIKTKNISNSTQNLVINAIRFYYEKVKEGNKIILNIERPNNEKPLPKVLSEEEVVKIFSTIKNLKHRCLMFLIYSAGLRLSEAANLKIKDIQADRNLLMIRGGKGKKDRTTILSSKILQMLREYYKIYRPMNYLFEGTSGEQYSKRSIQAIFRTALLKAEIHKDASVHTLRHSFATHLLEAGTDIRYIQALLGHSSSKTTEIYTHVTTKGIDKIKSPFDNLNL